MQFDEIILKNFECMSCNKSGELRSNGWSNNYRYVHGLSSGKRNINMIIILWVWYYIEIYNKYKEVIFCKGNTNVAVVKIYEVLLK
jgi:hypothetical protein